MTTTKGEAPGGNQGLRTETIYEDSSMNERTPRNREVNPLLNALDRLSARCDELSALARKREDAELEAMRADPKIIFFPESRRYRSLADVRLLMYEGGAS